MSFYGTSIIFDGRPCEEFGLTLASIGSDRQDPGKIGEKQSILEDRTSRRSTPLHYGAAQNTPLAFPITLIVSDGGRRLDRYDIARISGWLTGHQDYRELIVCQPDMENVFYRCLITELEAVEVGMQIVGVKAMVTCDAPYAYFRCADTVISCPGTDPVICLYRNRSNVNGNYRPTIIVSGVGASVSLTNKTSGTEFCLDGMNQANKTIIVDCESEILTCDGVSDLYEHWNGAFPGFLRGDNLLELHGPCTLTIKNEFPWSVGY